MINKKLLRLTHPYARLQRNLLVSSPLQKVARPKILEGNFIQILIVDDNIIYHQILTRMLVQQFQVSTDQITCVTDPVQALYNLSLLPYTLIFMDFDMPLLNGIQTTSIIRQRHSLDDFINLNSSLFYPINIRPDNVTIPIVAISTNNEPNLYLEAGMSGCLPKPITLHQLNSVLIDFD